MVKFIKACNDKPNKKLLSKKSILLLLLMINILKMPSSLKSIFLKDSIIPISSSLKMYSAPKIVSILLLSFAKMETWNNLSKEKSLNKNKLSKSCIKLWMDSANLLDKKLYTGILNLLIFLSTKESIKLVILGLLSMLITLALKCLSHVLEVLSIWHLRFCKDLNIQLNVIFGH